MKYLTVHKKRERERFEDAATVWCAVDGRSKGAVLRTPVLAAAEAYRRKGADDCYQRDLSGHHA